MVVFDPGKSPCCGARIVFPARLPTCRKCGARLDNSRHSEAVHTFDRYNREYFQESIIGDPPGKRRLPLEFKN